MSALDLIMAASGAEEKLYVDDVFSAYTYTGNGGTQTINNGIALADKLTITAGEPLGGGFYVGVINGDGVPYALIAAPKASGESASLSMKTSNSTTPSTIWPWNGALNTTNMILAGAAAHPAASFCKNLSIGGYTDWVLPAKDQLELMYRQLKPDTTANTTSFGANPSSDPIGANYTAGAPSQTAIAAFKTGGSEAFATDTDYWSSTEATVNSSWSQLFSSGYQRGASSNYKTLGYRVRAVRMIPLSDPLLDKYRVKGEGGLVWTKDRSNGRAHILGDTNRGAANILISNLNNASTSAAAGYTSFNANGFSIGNSVAELNTSGENYVSWTFRKAPKFFDVVTYTGNGTSNRQIPHALGLAPGLITTKSTSTTGDWNTYHRSATGDLKLNTTVVQTGSKAIVNSADASSFTVSGVANTNGVSYVAYLWAHDPSVEGLIQCGTFTGNLTVNLGWEAQYLLVKSLTANSDWFVADSSRDYNLSYSPILRSQGANSEETTASLFEPHATGFTTKGFGTNTYIYMAIRRPNKPPKVGTEVFKPITRAGTGGVAKVTGVGFAPDVVLTVPRNNPAYTWGMFDKLRGGGKQLLTTLPNAEYDYKNALTTFDVDGITVGADGLGSINTSGAYSTRFLRRAPGFMDVVCHTGAGVEQGNVQVIPHGLGVVPELVITKSRNSTAAWLVTTNFTVRGYSVLSLNSTSAVYQSSYASGWVYPPTKDVLTAGWAPDFTSAGRTYVSYLFASLPGISKVGNYTGNGTTQVIPCGFSTGARFIMVKRTDAAGDWFVWDTALGIVADNDPHLSLNTTSAEVTTDDSVDPDLSGFIVNQVAATNVNVLNATYIFLAIS